MPSEATVDINRLVHALNESAASSQVTTMDVLQSAASYILAEMETRVPVASGNLRRSLGIRVVGQRIIIGPNPEEAPYAPYVEFDTKPHTITPKKGKTLAFRVNGRMVFARVVHHPGTKGQHFVRDSFNAWVDQLGTMAAEANIKKIKDAYQ